MMSVRKEYTDIYNEVQEELNSRIFNSEELFNHCMVTCRKLFDIAEFKWGKLASNIPDSIIDDIGALYDEKYGMIEDKKMPAGKYDYTTSRKNFLDDNRISMYDLAMILDGKSKKDRIRKNRNEIDNDTIDGRYDELKKIYRKFLLDYFGCKYGDNVSDDIKYEMIRLTRILYDCKYLCEIDLGVLRRVSAVQFRMDIPSYYQKAINFIKMRTVIRRHDSDYHMSFQTLIRIERYCSALKSFIYSFPIKAVDNILENITMPSYETVKYINNSVYSIALDNLNIMDVLSEDKDKKITAEENQAYSYANLLMIDIESMYIYADAFMADELSDKVYSGVDFHCQVHSDRYVSDIGKYAKSMVNVISAIAFADEGKVIGDDGNASRIFIDRINNHIPYYETLMRIYNISIKRDGWHRLGIREAILLICIFEKLNSAKFDIPLYSGRSGTRHKKQKIKKLLEKMLLTIDNIDDDSRLTEDEYFHALLWLSEYMFMVIRCQTKNDRNLMIKLQKKLCDYFKKTVPLLVEYDYTVSINAMVEKILPRETRQKILEKATQKNELSKYVYLVEG